MVEPPQQEGEREQPRALGVGAPPVAEEHDAGPQRDRREERRRRDAPDHEVADPVDHDPGPQHGQQRDPQIARAPARALRELERRPQQQERGEPGDRLVGEQPRLAPADQVGRDGAEAHRVEPPGAGPAGEIGAPGLRPQTVVDPGEQEGHHRLEAQRAQLDSERIHALTLPQPSGARQAGAWRVRVLDAGRESG